MTYIPGKIRAATNRITTAIQNDEPRSLYQADIDTIESESRQLLIDIIEARA